MVLLFLFAGDCPLFELFLVPVEFQFDLLYFFVDTEDAHLYVIESFLIVDNYFIELFDFALESSALSFGDLPHVILCFSFFVFGVDECFGIELLLVYVLAVFLENLFTFEIFIVLFVDFFDVAFLLADLNAFICTSSNNFLF